MKFNNFSSAKIKALLVFTLMSAHQLVLAGDGVPLGNNDIRIMTQNLYVGADIFKVLDETQPIVVNAAEIFADIVITNFSERAEVIADQVAAELPHLIGLQEVSLIRTQCPGDALTNPGPNAPDVYADYLQILMNALSARGLNYVVAASVQNVDVELPANNVPQVLAGCAAGLFDARLTDYDVTLRRSDVPPTAIVQSGYQANFPVPVPSIGGTITFSRGFTIVDAVVNGTEIRFANTHLEVTGNPYSDAFQFAQAFELTETLNGLATTLGDKITFVTGDFNSDPAQGPLVDCFAPPTFDTLVPNGCVTPYFTMVNSGFIDLWSRLPASAGPGVTCCQNDLLNNPTSAHSQRIDYVWARLPATSPLVITSVDASVLGTTTQTTGGLWPSDHAGVAARVVFGTPAPPQAIPTLSVWAIILLMISVLSIIYFQSAKLMRINRKN